MRAASSAGSKAYAAELNKRCRPPLKVTNKSYRVDEAYIKVKCIMNLTTKHENDPLNFHKECQEKYLYRDMDSTGRTIDFCSQRNAMRLPSGLKHILTANRHKLTAHWRTGGAVCRLRRRGGLTCPLAPASPTASREFS
jgi:hypothetical protein